MNFRPDNDALKPIADRINDVAFALYRELSDRGNLIFSPLGIYCVLRMLFEGARGETRQALSLLLREQPDTTAPASLQALLAELESYTRPTDAELKHFERAAKARTEHEEYERRWRLEELKRPKQPGEIRLRRANIFGTATEEDVRLQLSIANGIWIQEGYTCKPDFLSAIQTLMAANAASVDFKRRPDESCNTINAWVGEQTHGRIRKMLSPAAISPLTRTILGNALYFKARWQSEFNDPKPGDFFLLDETRVRVPTLTRTFGSLKHIQESDFWSVELPYYKRPVAMVLVVPTDPGGYALASLERQMTRRWAEMIPYECEERLEVTLTIPEFKIRGGYRLGGVLSQLGLDSVFSHEADLSGISEEPGFGVDEAFHDAYIAVDQHGTEATAATLPSLIGYTPPPRRINLTINRPFLFAILDKKSGVILFLGKVENPE